MFTDVPAPAIFTVVAVAFTRLNVVAEVVISPPLTAKSPVRVVLPVTANVLLRIVAPVIVEVPATLRFCFIYVVEEALPIFTVVALVVPKFIVVAVEL